MLVFNHAPLKVKSLLVSAPAHSRVTDYSKNVTEKKNFTHVETFLSKRIMLIVKKKTENVIYLLLLLYVFCRLKSDGPGK